MPCTETLFFLVFSIYGHLPKLPCKDIAKGSKAPCRGIRTIFGRAASVKRHPRKQRHWHGCPHFMGCLLVLKILFAQCPVKNRQCLAYTQKAFCQPTEPADAHVLQAFSSHDFVGAVVPVTNKEKRLSVSVPEPKQSSIFVRSALRAQLQESANKRDCQLRWNASSFQMFLRIEESTHLEISFEMLSFQKGEIILSQQM